MNGEKSMLTYGVGKKTEFVTVQVSPKMHSLLLDACSIQESFEVSDIKSLVHEIHINTANDRRLDFDEVQIRQMQVVFDLVNLL